jgi:hypothetical protein
MAGTGTQRSAGLHPITLCVSCMKAQVRGQWDQIGHIFDIWAILKTSSQKIWTISLPVENLAF